LSKKGLLVIVPCGMRKIWDAEPNRGPTKAKDTYQGAPFKVNREYAEKVSDKWVILSAKHGFIEPDFVIPQNYNVTFKNRRTDPVSALELQAQIESLGLSSFEKVVGLGGKEYRNRIEEAFRPFQTTLLFPFSGLPIGKAMQAIKKALAARKPSCCL